MGFAFWSFPVSWTWTDALPSLRLLPHQPVSGSWREPLGITCVVCRDPRDFHPCQERDSFGFRPGGAQGPSEAQGWFPAPAPPSAPPGLVLRRALLDGGRQPQVFSLLFYSPEGDSSFPAVRQGPDLLDWASWRRGPISDPMTVARVMEHASWPVPVRRSP